MNELIRKLGDEVKNGNMTWQEVADQVKKEHNEELTSNAAKKRYYRMIKRENNPKPVNVNNGEFETLYGDGTVEAQKIVNLSPEEKANPDIVLKKLGYDPTEWELVMMSFSNWQQHTKEQETKELYAVKFRIKPRIKEITTTDYLKVAKEVFAKEIKPYKLPKRETKKELNDEILLMCPAIELHLGKLAWAGETGENYDHKIAVDRFEDIILQTSQYQDIAQAGNLYIGIGNDFFHSDTINYTTSKGTQLSNDLRWQKMFLVGLELYTKALLTLRDKFNNVDVNLVSGNHDTMASFYLYIALQQRFANDDIIKFSDNLKQVQCKVFGNNSIFTAHGDKNFKRMLKSIPVEFYQEWGMTKYRNLFLGHLHTEKVVDEDSGLVVRRVGSPSGTDEWHYNERFIGSRQQHQLFLFDYYKGLINSHYIVFESDKKKLNNEKVLIKR